jgi:nicotinamidase/pyrazinamidase
MDPEKDSYSAFHAENQAGARFDHILQKMGITELFVAGLATDYCVRFTCRDALRHGFKVKILLDAIQGVNLKPKDSENAIREMVKAGAKKITLKDIK